MLGLMPVGMWVYPFAGREEPEANQELSMASTRTSGEPVPM